MDKIYDFGMAEQRVMILHDEKQIKTASGIYIPDSVDEEKPKVGIVIRSGEGSSDNPMKYFPGDRVLLSKYSGVEIEVNFVGLGKKTFIVTNQLDIMAKVWEVEK